MTDRPAGLAARGVMLLIRGYQKFISPLRGPTCRFYPSCSAYAMTSVSRFGFWRGTWMAVQRLLRCHPWNPGGVDKVPENLIELKSYRTQMFSKETF